MSALDPHPAAGRCGGCRDLGAHVRWCPEEVGPYAGEIGRWSELCDQWGDRVGANDPALSNQLWAVADELRSWAETISERHGRDDYRTNA